MNILTKVVSYEAERFPGPTADIELQTFFDSWLLRNQGNSFFRYAGDSRLIISNDISQYTEATPGDWIVAYADGLCVYDRQTFFELFEFAETT